VVPVSETLLYSLQGTRGLSLLPQQQTFHGKRRKRVQDARHARSYGFSHLITGPRSPPPGVVSSATCCSQGCGPQPPGTIEFEGLGNQGGWGKGWYLSLKGGRKR